MQRSVFWCVIPAAGSGARFSAQRPKQYWKVANKTILEHTVKCFLSQPWVKGVVVAIAENDPYFKHLPIANQARVITVKGGETRAQSVMNALIHLNTCANPHDWIMVHDAVRPCLHEDDLEQLLKLQDEPVGGILATQVVDTLKQVNADLQITKTVERSGMWQAQTPQMFRLSLLHEALFKAHELGLTVTDEASAIEAQGVAPRIIRSEHPNPKLTYTADLAYISSLLEQLMENVEA